MLRGIWRAGGVAVPLAVTDPAAELDYVLRDSGADTLVTGQGFAHAIAPLAAAADVRLCTTDDLLEMAPQDLAPVAAGRRALIVYSSGTTARPKGVVLTHANVAAHVASLTSAWAWTADDRTLLVLPLHHVHGLINVLVLRDGRRRLLRDAAALRRRRDVGAARVGRDHGLHRGADDLSPADRGLGGRAGGAAPRLVGRRRGARG